MRLDSNMHPVDAITNSLDNIYKDMRSFVNEHKPYKRGFNYFKLEAEFYEKYKENIDEARIVRTYKSNTSSKFNYVYYLPILGIIVGAISGTILSIYVSEFWLTVVIAAIVALIMLPVASILQKRIINNNMTIHVLENITERDYVPVTERFGSLGYDLINGDFVPKR
ncbi:hypothetical protein [Terribacillus saccharophilus]|uniref:hypothetical protein n=1 Tax=Terribacillus saccharophilus TaxID=361277 RepID=UPI002989F367|nr:hypothetical protein [Terribacillus saccharophilus]MCM3227711.1 hypothetical protein [Terribacillus saccharophilus]